MPAAFGAQQKHQRQTQEKQRADYNEESLDSTEALREKARRRNDEKQ